MRDRRLKILVLVAALAVLVSAVQARDEWISVRTKNFHLIGNAKEKELRQVAAKLEQFHESFRLLFPKVKFTQSIDTNVVVFKDDRAYKPFKPRRADGKIDEGIAGYFQPGEDVNYITLSTEGSKEDTYGTIFHEYVHFLIDTHFGRSQVPPWFNEGLAEYYQTFEIENDQKVFLGRLQNEHLYLLQRTKMIPLEEFFSIDQYSLNEAGRHSRSIFYAQAWALVHYLIQGGQNQNLDKFLSLVMSDVKPEEAFKQAFGLDYTSMEKALGNYVKQRKFQVRWLEFDRKLNIAGELTVTALSEGDANAYLGDLLYHTREYDEAESYLNAALALEPEHSLANTALGLVRMRQGKYREARLYLEKAVASNPRNHLAQYNLAFVLSREGVDEFGMVSEYSGESAEKMRAALKAAIDIEPSFSPSYRLLAFINLVNDDNLEEAIEYLNKGLAIQPGNQEYEVLAARIYLKQENFDEAERIATRIVNSAGDDSVRRNAQSVLNIIRSYRESIARAEAHRKELEAQGLRPPIIRKREELSERDMEEIERQNMINSLHAQLVPAKEGEERIIGYISKIECIKGKPKYNVTTEKGDLTLASEDFQSLRLLSFVRDPSLEMIGCGSDLSGIKAVFTYLPSVKDRAGTEGTLVSLVFVPEFFRLKSPEELAAARNVVVVDEVSLTERRGGDSADGRRDAILAAIKRSLRTPKEGEQRLIGVPARIECGKKYNVFIVKSEGKNLRLMNRSPEDLSMRSFTEEARMIRFGCGAELVPVRSVITYRNVSEKGIDGEIVSIEFVPDSFEL